MTARTVASVLAAALLLQAAAAYDCPSTCVGASNCHAASYNIPGGLAPADTPQFIVLTNDDAITVVTSPIILNITERHTNKNGCKMPATWFVSQNFTDPSMVAKMYARGDEIATHTISHIANPNATEIVGQRVWLNQTAKIPLEDLQGFRAPYLLFTPEQRKILFDNGFRYDSSISESWNAKSAISPSASQRVWPYTFDCGIAQDCTVSTGLCESTERYPGLWEFPLYASQAEDGTVIGTMDPQGNMTDIFKREFDNRYFGARAPVGIFIHAAWLIAQPEHAGQINDFIEYAMSHDNVYLATISQVLDWIKNPVPASQYNPACKATSTGSECLMPQGGCASGAFNPQACKCDCLNENVNAGGFCRDAIGACTVQKDFDFVNKVYFCPANAGSMNAPGAAAASPPAPKGTTVNGPAECGHELVSYMGTTLTSSQGNSASYAMALRAIDGDCNTCAFAETLMGTPGSFDLTLPQAGNFTGVELLLATPANVTLSVGTDSARTVCIKDVFVPANSKVLVPCNLTGNALTISYPGNMSICDIYPRITIPPPVVAVPTTPVATTPAGATAAPAAGTTAPAAGGVVGTTPGGATTAPAATPAAGVTVPTTTQVPVTLELDINNMTPEQFKSVQAALCGAIVGMTGDMSATCTVMSVTANNRRRRSLQQAQQSVHVVLEIKTSNPETAAKAFNNGPMLSSLLAPLGFNISPSTVSAKAQGTATPTTGTVAAPVTVPSTNAPTSSGGSGSSTNIGAIVGGVVGGICGLALIVGGVFYWRRRKAAKESNVDKVSNPVYDATATVTTERQSSRKASSSPSKTSSRSLPH